MPLHYRRRGEVWHVRGTVRVSRATFKVAEFSTGCRTRAAAEAVGAEEEARIRNEALGGPGGRSARLTIADCIGAYLTRPGGVAAYDEDRLADLNERIGLWALDMAEDAWQSWLRDRGAKMAPATAARWRAILQAALNHARKDAPKLTAVREKPGDRIAYLTIHEQERLLASYNKWVAPIAVTLCFTGLRTQEALRLDWRHVDWDRGTLYVADSKSGFARTVPMHQRVRTALTAVWEKRKKPLDGHVFLSQRGDPYTDTRETGSGGNPLTKAHKTACAKAKIKAFRVHDWRHHFASWMVMRGADLHALMRIGGWSSLRMVQRYAAVSNEHLSDAVAKLV